MRRVTAENPEPRRPSPPPLAAHAAPPARPHRGCSAAPPASASRRARCRVSAPHLDPATDRGVGGSRGPSPEDDGFDRIVSAAARGDARSIEYVLRTVHPFVVRYCRGRIGRSEWTFASADDVAQDVCLTVLTDLPRYRRQGGAFLAWVYGIAAHKVVDAHRAVTRSKLVLVADAPEQDAAELGRVEGPERRALRGETAAELGRLLEVLPSRQREMLILRVVHGLSAEETATVLGATPGAVRLAQHRALVRLRQAMAGPR
jgi:RNA polymerase sigma-70 factor, ECF subfamily